MKISIHLSLVILFILGNASLPTLAQDELEIEWFCPRENTNINDGILIGASLKNNSDQPQQVFFSIQHTETIVFFQSGDDLLSPTNTMLDQSQVLTFQPGEEKLFAVLYAANVGTYDLTMTAQILDGPFWQQACRVNVVNNTEVDLALSITINDIPIESARLITSHSSLFWVIEDQVNLEAFYKLMNNQFGLDLNPLIPSPGYARDGNQEFEWKVGDEIILELLIENLSDQIAFDQQLFVGLPPGVFEFVRKANSIFDLDEIEEFTTGYIIKLLAEEFGPGATIEFILEFLIIDEGEGLTRVDVSTSSWDEKKENNQKCFEYKVDPPAEADIAVEKEVSTPLFPTIGDTICYTVKVTNNGPENASNVTVLDPIPQELEYVSSEISNDGSVSLDGDTLIAYWAFLNVGTTETLTIKAVVKEKNTIQNIASTQGPYIFEDPNPENNQDSASFPVFEIRSISVKQYSFKEPIEVPNSSKGTIEVEYENSTHIRYINACISNPEDENGHWLLRNGLFYPAEGPGTKKKRFAIDFQDIPAGDGEPVEEVEIQIEVTDFPLTDCIFNPNIAVNVPVELEVIQIFDGVLDEYTPPPFEEIDFPDIIVEGEDTCIVQRTDSEINIDLNKNSHPAVDNGYAGDQNACAPAAVANSFEWMESSGVIPSTIPHREKLEELSGMMKRQPNRGVFTKEVVEGKLAYIDKYRLPVSVEYETLLPAPNKIKSPNPNTRSTAKRRDTMNYVPTWDFLIRGMKEGKGVEIDYTWEKRVKNNIFSPDSNVVQWDTLLGFGSHMATVVEASEIYGIRKLSIRDDFNQCADGGLRPMEEFTWSEYTGRPRLLDLDRITTRFKLDTIVTRRVRSIVVQCFDPEVTHYVEDLEFQALNPETFPITTPMGRILVRIGVQPNGELVFVNARTNEVVPNNQRDDEENWLLRNIPIIPSSDFDTLQLWLNTDNTALSPLTTNDTVQIDMQIESSITTSDSFDILYAPTSVIEEQLVQIPSGSNSPGNNLSELPVSTLPTFETQDQVNYHLLEKRPRPLDIDSTAYQSWAQDGIAAMSTVLHQLSQVGDFEEMEITEKFNLVQHFTATSSGQPVNRENLIQSTLELIDSMQIPVSIAFQSIQFDQDSIPSPNSNFGHFASNQNSENPDVLDWEWFKEQIDEEIPVILEFGYYGPDGIRAGGHWVVAYGYSEVGSNKAFYFLDDLDQSSSEGAGQFLSYWDENEELTFVNPISGPDYAVRIESAIAAQYDPAVEFMTTALVNNHELSVTVRPNPIQNGELFIQGQFPNHSSVDVVLFNTLGQSVLTKTIRTLQPDSQKINLPNLPKGTYYLKITQDKAYAVAKVMIQ